MAGLLGGDPTQSALDSAGASSILQGKLEEVDDSSANWYFPREEVERNSPSLADGIDTKRETYLRKSYCTFLQDLGMRLKVPQVTIATAITFCHRFYLRQSHGVNDRFMVATVCMFLAGKVEETPRTLKDVIIVSYGIRYRKDPAAANRIKQKKLYEQQKELVLDGERLVLATLGFDLNVYHPYRPLVAAIKKFKVSQNALAQAAWNFVNDGLRTSLCLQFKPHHIAAGAIFLAAKFLNVKLPSDGEKPWWQEFDVNPRQLEEVSNQMLELYEQNKIVPASNPDEVHNGRTEPDQNHSAPAANGHYNGKAGMEFRDGMVGMSNEPRNRQYPEAYDKRRAHDGDEFKDVDSGSEVAERTQDKRKRDAKWSKSEEGELPSRFEDPHAPKTRHEPVERETAGYRQHPEHHNNNHYYPSQRSDADRERSRTHSKDREPKKSRHK